MNGKHSKIIEDVVADLLKVYLKHLETVQDDLEYYSVVSGMLVFKRVALSEVLETIQTMSDDNPEDIEMLLEHKSIELASSIKTALSKSLN